MPSQKPNHRPFIGICFTSWATTAPEYYALWHFWGKTSQELDKWINVMVTFDPNLLIHLCAPGGHLWQFRMSTYMVLHQFYIHNNVDRCEVTATLTFDQRRSKAFCRLHVHNRVTHRWPNGNQPIMGSVTRPTSLWHEGIKKIKWEACSFVVANNFVPQDFDFQSPHFALGRLGGWRRLEMLSSFKKQDFVYQHPFFLLLSFFSTPLFFLCSACPSLQELGDPPAQLLVCLHCRLKFID